MQYLNVASLDFLIALMASGYKIIKAETVEPFKGRPGTDIASHLLNFRVKAVTGKSRIKGKGNRLKRSVNTFTPMLNMPFT